MPHTSPLRLVLGSSIIVVLQIQEVFFKQRLPLMVKITLNLTKIMMSKEAIYRFGYKP